MFPLTFQAQLLADPVSFTTWGSHSKYTKIGGPNPSRLEVTLGLPLAMFLIFWGHHLVLAVLVVVPAVVAWSWRLGRGWVVAWSSCSP